MASSKVMPSANSRNSDLSRRSSSSASSSSGKPQHQYHHQHQHQELSFSGQAKRGRSKSKSKLVSTMTVDGILRDVYDANPPTESTLLDASITLIEAPAPGTTTAAMDINRGQNQNQNGCGQLAPKSVDDMWREIVSGERKEMKEEAPDEMMTLEDFLAKAGAVEAAAEKKEEMDVKLQPERLSGGVYAFDPVPPSPFQVEGSIVGFGNGVDVIGAGGSAASGGSGGGRGKRARLVLEPLDKAAQQRQRRMIKNRESAARSRERKQAYQVELESLAVRLEEENERLLKEKAERTKEQYKQWHPSRPGFFYFSFNNGSLNACREGSLKLAIKVITPTPPSKDLPPTTTPAPISGGVISSSPSYPWPFRPRQGTLISPVPAPTENSPVTVPALVPDKGGGGTGGNGGGSTAIPFINSNPAVPLPTGEVDSATIRPLPTSGQPSQVVVGFLAGQTALFSIILLVL